MRFGSRFAVMFACLMVMALPLFAVPAKGASEVLRIATGSGPDKVYMSPVDSIELRLPLAFAIDGKEQIYIHDPGMGQASSGLLAVPGDRIQIFRQNMFVRTISLPREMSPVRLSMLSDSKDRIVIGDGKIIFRTDQWGSYSFSKLEDLGLEDVRMVPFMVFDDEIAIPESGGYWKQLLVEYEKVFTREERYALFTAKADLFRAPIVAETKGMYLSRSGFFAGPNFGVFRSFGNLMKDLRKRKIGTLFGEVATFILPSMRGNFAFRGIDQEGNTYWVTDPPGDRGGNGRACIVYDQFGRTIADITISCGDLSGEPLPVIDRFGNVYGMQFWQDGTLTVVKYQRFW